MPGLLTSTPLTAAEQRANDTHRTGVVLAVLAVLAVYTYLFTDIAEPLGVPSPQELVTGLGVHIDHVFDSDRNVDSNVQVLMTQRFRSNDDERLVLLAAIAVAFLSAYYLPLRFKQPALVFWTVVAIVLLYGARATSGLLFAHLLVYVVFHPGHRYRFLLSALIGVLAYLGFLHDFEGRTLFVIPALGAPLLALLLYRYAVLPLLRHPRAAAMLRALIIHSALVAIGVSLVVEALRGDGWSAPLGLLLFFWQWARLVMYHIDYKDGLVPADAGLGQYLPVFLSPGALPNWSWGVTIPQGYAYIQNNFLCEDKNRLVMAGVKLLCIALVYLIFWSWIRYFLVDVFSALGVEVYGSRIRSMVRAFMRGAEVTTPSVLATTFLDLVRFMMFFAGVVHFKVGIWRICGYRIDPYYNKPWLATDLMTFWTRFAFHYREFLVRAFYYPAFFRFVKLNRNLRIFLASMAAAGLGNLIWHITEKTFFNDLEWGEVSHVLGTWPYFFLLGLGIAVSQIYLMSRKRTRKPWSRDWWLLKDVVAVYLVLQYFAIIHIFLRPVDGSTVGDLFRLFLIGFGIHLPE